MSDFEPDVVGWLTGEDVIVYFRKVKEISNVSNENN